MKPMIADILKNCVGVLQTHPDLISFVKIFFSPISAFDFWVRTDVYGRKNLLAISTFKTLNFQEPFLPFDV